MSVEEIREEIERVSERRRAILRNPRRPDVESIADVELEIATLHERLREEMALARSGPREIIVKRARTEHELEKLSWN